MPTDDKIVQFPTESVRNWREIEQSVTSALAQAGADDACTAFVIGRVKAAFNTLPATMNVTAPEECSGAIQEIIDHMHESTAAYLYELVRCYIFMWNNNAGQ